MLSIDRALSQKEQLQRNYDTFKEQKWQEYSKHHPNMTIKQATAKIVKDWNMLTIHQQLEYVAAEVSMIPLNLNFQEKNAMTPNKLEQLNELGSTDSRKSAKNMQEQVDPQVQESLRVNLAMMSEMQGDETKLRMKKKGGNMGYIQFYKGQYSKYSREHPKWTCQQISVIIKLLWKSKQMTRAKRMGMKQGKMMKTKRIVSGRKAFLTAMGKNGMMKWKKLPLESRTLWNKQGNPNLMKNEAHLDQAVRLSSNPSNLNFINIK